MSSPLSPSKKECETNPSREEKKAFMFQTELPSLFEYNAHNFVRNFNQKLRVRIMHEFFISTLYFYFFFSLS